MNTNVFHAVYFRCMRFSVVKNHEAFPKPKRYLHQNSVRNIALGTVLVKELLKLS